MSLATTFDSRHTQKMGVWRDIARELQSIAITALILGGFAGLWPAVAQAQQLGTVVQYATAVEPFITVPLVQSLLNASIDETAGTWVYVGFCRETSVFITWNTGTVSGGVTIDTTDDTTSAATPAPLTTEIAFSGTAPNKTIVQITGFEVWVRARISTVIGGATVSAKIGCN